MSENPNHPIRPQAWKIADLTLRELLKLALHSVLGRRSQSKGFLARDF
jgi:hypothetical protein